MCASEKVGHGSGDVVLPFRQQARVLAIVPDHLDQIAALAAKDKQMAAMWIGFQRLLHQQGNDQFSATRLGDDRT